MFPIRLPFPLQDARFTLNITINPIKIMFKDEIVLVYGKLIFKSNYDLNISVENSSKGFLFHNSNIF